jgi:hypothetical protein
VFGNIADVEVGECLPSSLGMESIKHIYSSFWFIDE